MANNSKITGKIEVIENRSRRKAVKTIAGGVTALAAYNLLPVRWEKPIIEQVFLPAHAQTSGEIVEQPPTEQPPAEQPPAEQPPAEQPPAEQPPAPISSSPSSIEATNPGTAPDIDIHITFDGGTNLQLITSIGTIPSDTIIGFDTDTGSATTWDLNPSGSNWSIIDSGGIVASNNNSGTYTIQASGYGSTYQLTFTIVITGVTPNPTATVSDVTIIEIP